jgi:ketosteroid isomerase-like protein
LSRENVDVVTRIYDVVIGRSRGRAKRTGQEFDVPIVHIWTLREGKAVRGQVHMDTARMVRALAG